MCVYRSLVCVSVVVMCVCFFSFLHSQIYFTQTFGKTWDKTSFKNKNSQVICNFILFCEHPRCFDCATYGSRRLYIVYCQINPRSNLHTGQYVVHHWRWLTLIASWTYCWYHRSHSNHSCHCSQRARCPCRMRWRSHPPQCRYSLLEYFHIPVSHSESRIVDGKNAECNTKQRSRG